ncbi:MAG: hypothetical protein ACKD6N_06000 [Candidatus Bathyarchaeota archaeon]
MANSLKLDKKLENHTSKNSNPAASSINKHAYIKDKNTLLQLSSDYSRTFKLLLETRKKVVSVKEITEENGLNTSNSWLVKTGLFLILAVPEPFISDIIGATLLCVGAFKEKANRKSCIKDYYREFHENLQNILKLKKEIATL